MSARRLNAAITGNKAHSVNTRAKAPAIALLTLCNPVLASPPSTSALQQTGSNANWSATQVYIICDKPHSSSKISTEHVDEQELSVSVAAAAAVYFFDA